MFKGLGNLASVMRQAQEMGGKMQEVNEELKSKRVTGSAGGGMIEVEANGHGEVLRVKDHKVQDRVRRLRDPKISLLAMGLLKTHGLGIGAVSVIAQIIGC